MGRSKKGGQFEKTTEAHGDCGQPVGELLVEAEEARRVGIVRGPQHDSRTHQPIGVESEIGPQHGRGAAEEQSAADEQDQRPRYLECDQAGAKMPHRPAVGCGVAGPAQIVGEPPLPRRQERQEGQRQRNQQTKTADDQEDCAVDGDRCGPMRRRTTELGLDQRCERPEQPAREHQPDREGGRAQEHALGDQHSREVTPLGAERGADRDFFLAPHRPQHHQHREVRAHHDEHEARRHRDSHQDRLQLPDVSPVDRFQPDAAPFGVSPVATFALPA